MNQEIIGKFIAKKRKEKNLTQQELAEKLGVTYQAISKWENGRGMPDYPLFEPLCKELGITTSELLSGGQKDDKTVEYIKYKDKKDRRILIYVILSALVIITLLITNQILTYRNFYKTNYDKTQVTKLYGSGELFDVNNMLVITSPEKTIMVTGKIESQNQEIKDENITGYSIDSEKRHIASESGSHNLLKPRILEEPNGYNELFTEEDISNLDKWSITIYYKNDNKELSEEIKLTPEQILTTDKYEREEIEPIARPEDQPEKKDLSEIREKLIEKGFEQKGTDTWELVEKDYAILFMLDVDYFGYYNLKTHKRIEFLYFMRNNFERGGINYSPPSDGDRMLISYEIDNDSITCSEGQGSKCNDAVIVEEEKKDIKDKLKLIKSYLN